MFISVMYSLIHNAMKYSDANTHVTLQIDYEGFSTGSRHLSIKVKSKGIPIRVQEKDRIFEKFQRGEEVEKRFGGEGVGIGLWVASQLIRGAGGDLALELDDNNPRLSLFVVTLPAKSLVERAV